MVSATTVEGYAALWQDTGWGPNLDDLASPVFASFQAGRGASNATAAYAAAVTNAQNNDTALRPDAQVAAVQASDPGLYTSQQGAAVVAVAKTGKPQLAFSVGTSPLSALPIGAAWTASVFGAPANSAIRVRATIGGATFGTGVVGTTDANGNLSVSDFVPNQPGSWHEDWLLPDGTIFASLDFTVIPNPVISKDPSETVNSPGNDRLQSGQTATTVAPGTFPADTRGTGYGTLPAGSGNPNAHTVDTSAIDYPIDGATQVAMQTRAPGRARPSQYDYLYEQITHVALPAVSTRFADDNAQVTFQQWWNQLTAWVTRNTEPGGIAGTPGGGLAGLAGGAGLVKWAAIIFVAYLVAKKL